jgi:ATP-dependent 26S proteasome regulatory subunit
LSSKLWSQYEVDHIHDIDFNTSAFDLLTLAQDKKEMISALVRSAKVSSNQFDDMIKGKGKGIIFLLHGPPGVGKTYTAGM